MANTATDDAVKFRLYLVGDSDIERWPRELVPRGRAGAKVHVSGYSGATLQQVLNQTDEIFTLGRLTGTTVWVVCAGENDIGNGVPLWESKAELSRLLSRVQSLIKNDCQHRLIFLGPKLEPWLQDDQDSRKQYIQLSRAFQRECAPYGFAMFLDCLTMFCMPGDDQQPGALLKARPDPSLFDADLLHLSDAGYLKLKTMVEEAIESVLSFS